LCQKVDVITQYRQTKTECEERIAMEMPKLTLEIPTLHTLGKTCLISHKSVLR